MIARVHANSNVAFVVAQWCEGPSTTTTDSVDDRVDHVREHIHLVVRKESVHEEHCSIVVWP